MGAILGLVVAGAAYSFFRDDCEVISYPAIGIHDDRWNVAAFEDRSLFDRESTKEIMRSLFPSDAANSLTFCSRINRRSLQLSRGAVVVLFGKHCSELKAFSDSKSYLWIIFPTAAPPPGKTAFVETVVLSARDSSQINKQWKIWCRNHNITCAEVLNKNTVAVIDGVKIAEDLYRSKLEQKREPTSAGAPDSSGH